MTRPSHHLTNHDSLYPQCDFERAGCTHVCQLDEVQDHVKLCPFNPDGEMVCEAGCGLKFLRKKEPEHRCIDALKELIKKKDIEIADLKKGRGVKRPFDATGMRLTEMSANRYLATHDELRHRLRSVRVNNIPPPVQLVPVSNRPGTSGDDASPPRDRRQPLPRLHDVRVMVHRLTDEQIERANQMNRSSRVRAVTTNSIDSPPRVVSPDALRYSMFRELRHISNQLNEVAGEGPLNLAPTVDLTRFSPV